MKYLRQNEKGIWCFDDYFDHLLKLKSITPPNLVGLIHDQDRYWLDSPKSFHDAWLQTLRILGRHGTLASYGYSIQISLLGPFHDRIFELDYQSVRSFATELTNERYRSQAPRTNTDDLIVHEFDLTDDGLLEHRMLFESGLEIFVACSDLTFREVMIDTADSAP